MRCHIFHQVHVFGRVNTTLHMYATEGAHGQVYTHAGYIEEECSSINISDYGTARTRNEYEESKTVPDLRAQYLPLLGRVKQAANTPQLQCLVVGCLTTVISNNTTTLERRVFQRSKSLSRTPVAKV